jgi:hypothetical protein
MAFGRTPFDILRDRLTVFVGPHTARNAIKTVSMRDLGVGPEHITVGQAVDLLAALRPMLNVLVGRASTQQILAQLAVELGLRA